MPLKSFPTPTMIAISSPMVDAEKDRPLLESYPPTAGMVRYIATAHNGLLRIEAGTGDREKKIKEMSEKATMLDEQNDDGYRSLYNILTGLAFIATGERRALLEGIRDNLMPEGLAGTQLTYLSESGRADAAKSRMTPEIETVFKETVVEGKNLYQIYSQWVEAGIALGDVERQRIRISEKADQNAITLGDVQRARFLWVRTMNVLKSLIELDPNIPEEIQVQILQPLKKAEERYSRKKSITDTDTDSDTDSKDDDAIPSVG